VAAKTFTFEEALGEGGGAPAPAPKTTFTFEEARGAQRDLPKRVKPSSAGGGRGSVNPPAAAPDPEPFVMGDPMGAGAAEMMAGATPRRSSVLEGMDIPEPTFNPERADRLSRRANVDADQRAAMPPRRELSVTQGGKPEPRGPLRALTDTGLGLYTGAVGMVKGITDNVNAGDNPASDALGMVQAGAQRLQSDDLRDQQIKREARILTAQRNGGELAAARVAYQSLFDLPAAGLDVAAQGTGSLIPTFGLGLVGAGPKVMAVVNAASTAGDSASDTAQRLKSLAPKDWMGDEGYQRLMQMGASHDQAVAILAPLRAVPSQIAGAVAGAISGGTGAERVIAGKAFGQSLKQRLWRAAEEIGGEQLETIAPKVAGNMTVGAVDGTTGATSGLGQAIVDTAAGTVGGAGVAASGGHPTAAQPSAEQMARDRGFLRAQPQLDAPAPAAPRVQDQPTVPVAPPARPATQAPAARATTAPAATETVATPAVTPAAVSTPSTPEAAAAVDNIARLLNVNAAAAQEAPVSQTNAPAGRAEPADTAINSVANETASTTPATAPTAPTVGAAAPATPAPVQPAVGGAPAPAGQPAAAAPAQGAVAPAKGWQMFEPASTLGVPRADMPQVKAEHRGALVNFLEARGIGHEQGEVPAASLKPTQAEFSPEKVAKAGDTQGDRAILVSSDGRILDGHHQWLAAEQKGEPVRVIKLDAPIAQLLNVVKEFPSAESAPGATKPQVQEAAIQPAPAEPVLSQGATGTAPKGGSNARGAAYQANPLKAFLGKHGLSPDLAAEFAPGKAERRAAMVPGYGPIFRKTGKPLDLLAQAAHEEGFLPSADPEQLYDMIGRALGGERIAPMYTADAAENEVRARIERQRAMEEDAVASLQDLHDNELFELDDAVDLMATSNTSTEDAMRALGFTEQEIADAVAQESGGPQAPGDGHGEAGQVAEGPAEAAAGRRAEAARPAAEGLSGADAGATARGGRGSEKDRTAANDQGARRALLPGGERADRSSDSAEPQDGRTEAGNPEGLTSPTREDVLAQQERRAARDRAEQASQREQDERARADAERDDFSLTGSDRPADANPDQGELLARRGDFDLKNGPPMTLSEVERATREIVGRWENAPEVHVVLSADRLPGNQASSTLGLYTQGAGEVPTVWIVASRNRTRLQLAKTLAHEAVAHYGLRAMLGREGWEQLMRNIQSAIKAGNRKLRTIQEEVRREYRDSAGAYAFERGPELGDQENTRREQIEADEVAARVVEQGVDADGNFRPGFELVKAVYAQVMRFLRSIGLNVLPFTTAELHGMLVLAQRNLQFGQRTLGGAEVAVGAPAARAEDGSSEAGQDDLGAAFGRMRSMQPVVVPGLGTGRSLPFLRDAAKAAYQRAAAAGPVITQDGREVQLTKVGFKKTQSHSADRRVLDLMASIREVLEKAVLLTSQPNLKPVPGDAVRAFLYYGAKVELAGQPAYAKLVVRESVNGEIYYDSDLSSVEDVDGRDVDATPAKPGAAPVSADKFTLADLARKVRAGGGDAEPGSFNSSGLAARGPSSDQESIPPAPQPLSRWRDATGRLQFAPGQAIYDLLGKAADPLLTRLSLKAAPQPLRRALRDMKLQVAKAQETAAAVAGETNKLSADERAMVSDIIEKELKAGTIPPEHAVRLATMINDVMGAQTDELVRLGMLQADSAEKWRGEYLPRYYESKLTRKVADAWADALRRIVGRPRVMRGISGKHLKGRGLYETIPLDQLEQYEASGWEVRDPDYTPGEGTKDGTVQVWRDFTREERENMSEIRDAGFRFVMGYMQTQRDIALGRMLEQLAADKDISSRTPTDKLTVRVPDYTVDGTGAKTYGKLAGRYVAPETLSHLSSIDEAQSEAWQMYRKAMSVWKEGKTALNLVSHVNNIVSNLTMAHLAGVSYWDVHKYMGAVRDMATRSALLKEANEAGLFLGTLSEAELMNMLPPELRKLAQRQEGTGEKIGRTAFNLLTFYLRKPMGWAYQNEDRFFRFLIYRDARGRGLDPQDAVDYAQRFIFTYDDLPKGARRIRDLAVPFFSYTYKAAPVLLHTALTHPLRIAVPAALLWGINAACYAIAAGDDDDSWDESLKKYLTDPEYREKVRKQEQLEREHLPSWMKGTTALLTPKTLRLGMDEVTKLPLFIDISRIIPGGDLFDVSPNAGGIPLPQPITPNHPLFTTAVAMLGNKDLFSGKELVDKNDTKGEAAAKRADWLWKQLTPAIAAGNYHWERWMNALAQATGKELTWLPDALGGDSTGIGRDGLPAQPGYTAAQTFGIKVRPIDIDRSEEMELSARDKMIRDIDAEMNTLRRLNRNGVVSDRAYDKALELANKKKDRLRDGLTVDGEKKD
jgi:hypothetical protein